MSTQYKPLRSDSDITHAASSEICDGEDGFAAPPSKSNSHRALLQALRTVGVFMLGALFTAALFLSRSKDGSLQISYENGFGEEKILPSHLIQLEQRKFTSPVDFRLDGTEFLVTLPNETAYVGATNDQIDRAWEELLWGRYFSISEAEAKTLWGADYQVYYDREKSGYTGGFDMFHQLHCLNQIRQALHRDYYPETRIHGPVHLDHCLNHLRQAIQCWGNTAITPLKWFEGYHHGYVQSDMVHTCRKFEPIREYVSERFNGSLAVPRRKKGVVEADNGF